jgi:hypothetical protein
VIRDTRQLDKMRDRAARDGWGTGARQGAAIGASLWRSLGGHATGGGGAKGGAGGGRGARSRRPAGGSAPGLGRGRLEKDRKRSTGGVVWASGRAVRMDMGWASAWALRREWHGCAPQAGLGGRGRDGACGGQTTARVAQGCAALTAT